MKKTLTYEKSGVSYKAMDPVKKNAQKQATSTAKNLKHLSEKEVSRSRGESAYVWDCGDHYRAFVVEGLGTKNLVADEMEQITGESYYQAIAQDTVAAIINDIITVGAHPEIINAYFAVGDSNWFSNKKRSADLITGWKKACDLSMATWGGGETPTYSGIIDPKTIDLGGAATGLIKPKSRLVLGDDLREGDQIILFASSGIHANGLTLTRKIASKLKKRFATKLKNGKMLGEAILTPTTIYARLIDEILESGTKIKYMVNITGHGWRKIMRHTSSFSYIIEQIPAPTEEFLFLQEHGPISDKEAYGNFNMGAGYAIFINPKDWTNVEKIAQEQKIKVINAGYIKDGPRQVIIKPKNITYTSETLDLR